MLTEIPGWHLGVWNNICFKKSGAIPGHGAGKLGVLEGLEFLTATQIWAWRPGIYWISCSSLDCYSLGTGTKPGSGVWVALAPWELLRRADSMDCWSWTPRKIRLFWVTLSWLHVLHSTPKIKELMEKNFVGLPQLPWSLSKTFPCFSDDCWTLCHHLQFKTWGTIPVLSFFHEKSKHDLGSRNPGGCCWVPSKSRAAFQFKPSINLIFVTWIPDPCLRWDPWKSWNALSVFLAGSATSCPHDSSVLLAFSGYFCNVPMDA